jgi:hypothetical protein
MATIGRNQVCPCGSGKKYKKCCQRKGVEPPSNISSVVIDRDRKRAAFVSGKLLINQFTRDGPQIEASFDRLCMADLEAMSELAGQAVGILFAGLAKTTSNGDMLRAQCAELMMNTVNAFSAAVQALRSGYVLAPGIIMRNVVETLAVVAHLMSGPKDLAKFQAGKFSSTSALAAAKKIVPVFGFWYGFLTERFSQYRQISPVPSARSTLRKNERSTFATEPHHVAGVALVDVRDRRVALHRLRRKPEVLAALKK